MAGGDKVAKTKRKTSGKVTQPYGPYSDRKSLMDSPEGRREVSALLGEVLLEFKRPRVRDDVELAQRLEEYFEHCAQTGQIPTMEEMALSTGYTAKTFGEWATGQNTGFSQNTSEIAQKAKALMAAFDAKLVVNGKVNFLTYCFRAKNYYGMKDRQDYAVEPVNTNVENYSLEDIKSRYSLPDVQAATVDSERL